MATDARWATSTSRVAHRDEWEAAFLDWSVDRTRGEVFEACQAEGVLCAPVLRADEVLKDPQFVAREFFKTVPHSGAGELTLPGPPFRMQEGGWAVQRPAPLLGQHNAEVYGEILGYGDDQLTALHRDGVV